MWEIASQLYQVDRCTSLLLTDLGRQGCLLMRGLLAKRFDRKKSYVGTYGRSFSRNSQERLQMRYIGSLQITTSGVPLKREGDMGRTRRSTK